MANCFNSLLYNRLGRVVIYFAISSYFLICLSTLKTKRDDDRMNLLTEFQLTVCVGGLLPSCLIEGLSLAKGRRIPEFSSFSFHFTPLLNCSIFVAAAMLMVLSVIQMTPRNETTPLVRNNGYVMIALGCFIVVGYPWYCCV